jgi:protein involved in polysaccharide export with SLBB domain
VGIVVFARLLIPAVLFGLLVGALSSCASAQAPKEGRGRVNAPELPSDQSSVQAGDVLIIEVFGERDLSGKFQVSDKGTIDYPLIGRVDVTDLSPPDVAALLRKRLRDGFLSNPHVSVFAEGYKAKRKVYVWGQVHRSGTFEFTNGMTVIEALTLAGGVTPMADKDGITLTRISDGKRKELNIPMNRGQSSALSLRPGDVVFVPERIF